jgi:hypothetical protein
MNTNQNKPLTSFLPANASPPAAAATKPKAGIWDDRLAAEIATESSADTAKVGQSSPTQSAQKIQMPPDIAKVGQSRPTQSEPETQISPDAAKVGQSGPNEIPQDQDDSEEVEAGSAVAVMDSPIFRRVDDKLVAEIAAGTSLREAAKRAGVSERTAHRRWANPEFQMRVLAVRAGVRCEVVGRLTEYMKKATQTLMNGMSAQSESVRVSAARAVLKIGQDMGGRQEENAMLAAQLKQMQSALDEARGEQQT